MTSVAFIGGDGAGKTTIARAVIQSSRLPMKYLYMGLSTRSSEHALLTSRLVLFLKRRAYKKTAEASKNTIPEDIPANLLEYGQAKHGGWLWNAARFLNHLAEAWYRQIIALGYQLRGYIVVYDRHFYFDAAPVKTSSKDRSLLYFDRLFSTLMSRWYPKPTLAIFLDTPPEMLFQRKGETSVGYLERQRGIYLEQGAKLPHFVRVDASQPVESVLAAVMRHIQDHKALLVRRRTGPAQHEEINRDEP